VVSGIVVLGRLVPWRLDTVGPGLVTREGCGAVRCQAPCDILTYCMLRLIASMPLPIVVVRLIILPLL
jgi:hypothetical protein